MRSLHKLILSVVVVLALAGLVHASSSYYVHSGKTCTLTWSSVSPSAGDPVIKCSTDKGTGAIVGLALSGSGTASENVTVLCEGIVDVTVTANVDGVGIGDYVFAAAPGAGTCTATLTETNSGIIYGQALEAIASGSSDRINVRIMQSAD